MGGQYKVTADITDDAGGRNHSEFTRYVSGADVATNRNVQQDAATVVPDKDQYRPGDTAQLLVIAPFTDGTGLLTVSANGAVQTQHFVLDHGSAVVKVPIAENDTHGVERAGRSRRTSAEAARRRHEGSNAPAPPGVCRARSFRSRCSPRTRH